MEPPPWARYRQAIGRYDLLPWPRCKPAVKSLALIELPAILLRSVSSIKVAHYILRWHKDGVCLSYFLVAHLYSCKISQVEGRC